jgi:predicted O-linked N-acetylglucosamine transferase (SPINDLY family)
VSGANFFKIIPELRHLWARLLAKIPESVLVLYPFGPAWSSSYPKSVFRDHFESTLSKYNVKKERLIILDPLPKREDIKELLRLADVYLDAVPYSGATSLLDPLEVGVPPVVMEGDELRFCQGSAILRELKVEELVVKSEEEYIELAGRLAIDNELRTDLREKILNRMLDTPPFLDPKGYARKISTALKNIVQSEIVQSEPESHATSI